MSAAGRAETARERRSGRDEGLILDGLAEPVLLVTSERRIATMNAAAREVFGADLAGRHVARAVRHPEVLAALEAVVGGRDRAQVVATLTQPAATYRVSVQRLRDAALDRAVACISFYDVSHVKRAEAMRSDFVANVSHELRSPLTAISTFIETLQTSARDDENARDRFLAIMGEEAARMDRLISDLLSLSRVEADERVRPRERVSLRAVLDRVVAIHLPAARDAGRSLAFVCEAQASDVAGDADQLAQVFANLIENALKYSRPGTTVRIDLARLGNAPGFPGEVLRAEVSDEGEGIAPEHLPRLTERFYRVDTGRSRAMGGTGLGLAIVKHIVSRHRGRLTIRSERGRGSTFTVLLPVWSS